MRFSRLFRIRVAEESSSRAKWPFAYATLDDPGTSPFGDSGVLLEAGCDDQLGFFLGRFCSGHCAARVIHTALRRRLPSDLIVRWLDPDIGLRGSVWDWLAGDNTCVYEYM